MNKTKKEEKKKFTKMRNQGKSLNEIRKKIAEIRFINALTGYKAKPREKSDRVKGWIKRERKSK